jgi:adenine-specific DNA-methyltransferase
MEDEIVENVSLRDSDPSSHLRIRNAIQDLLPGVIQDGVINSQHLSEVLGIPLSQSKDSGDRFGLIWAGRKNALAGLTLATRSTLRPISEKSANWDIAKNIFISGENLEVLRLLQKSYNDKVKLIYIDPPYNTANDFIYNDDFTDPIRHYLEITGQIDAEGNRTSAGTELEGRKHSKWLSMMYPRLILARNLLSEDGFIFISINDIEQANLRILCNEIFGEENFIANLIWMKGKEGGNDNQGFGIHHEYILCYSRNAEIATKKILLDEKDVSRHSLVLPEENQVVSSEEIYRDGEPFQLINLSKQKDYRVRIPMNNGKIIEWDSYCPQKTIDEYIRIGKIFVGKKGVPYVKSFLADEKDGSKPSSIVESKFGTTKAGGIAIRELFGDGKIFSYPKPPQLIKRLVEITCPPTEESIILDFFGGSATTAHGVLLQNKEDGGNRKFIVVTLPEKLQEDSVPFAAGYRTISDISIARIEKVLEKEKIANTGLRVFELDNSIFESNHSDFELNLRPNTLPNDFSDEQVVVEVFLKLGISLDAEWVRINAHGINAILCIDTLVVLNRSISQDLLDAVFEIQSFSTLVVLEDALADKDSLKANLFFSCRKSGIILRTI